MHISLVFGQIFNQFTFIDFVRTVSWFFKCTNFTSYTRTCLRMWIIMLGVKKFHLFLITANAHSFSSIHGRTFLCMKYVVKSNAFTTCLMSGCCLVLLLVVFYAGNISGDLLFSSISRKRYVCYCFCCLIVKYKNKCMVWNQAVIFTITWQHHIINKPESRRMLQRLHFFTWHPQCESAYTIRF